MADIFGMADIPPQSDVANLVQHRTHDDVPDDSEGIDQGKDPYPGSPS